MSQYLIDGEYFLPQTSLVKTARQQEIAVQTIVRTLESPPAQVAGLTSTAIREAFPNITMPKPQRQIATISPPQELELAEMPQLNIWEMLDVLLPEELLGLDITPGVQVGKETKGRVYYDNVWVEDGKVKTIRKGEPRTLGYTPRFAKKKYRTKRRRKRLTKRDMYILEVMKSSPSAGALALML